MGFDKSRWRRQVATLDAQTEHEEIARILGSLEFPWDTQNALSFALFRTYAVESIGSLLYDTGEFIRDTQKRHDDTVLTLESIMFDGLDSEFGHAAVRRMNRMHGRYDIANSDMVYVLCTFVVVPHDWIRDYGWRKLTAHEIHASVCFYRRLGKLMGMSDIPEDFDAFRRYMDDYERMYFVPNPKSRAVADSTLNLLASFYLKPLAPAVKIFSRALMDDALLEAFDFKKPPHWVRVLSRRAVWLRGRFVALLPPRRKPRRAINLKRVKSYPGGFMLEHLENIPDPPVES